GPRRDKPACSPIGMHGACGKCFLSGETLVVRDVKDLGPNYVACDPRDQSELVVPCVDSGGACWAVLDFDSFDVGAFGDADARGAIHVLEAAGLTVAARN
ncbi:MAG: GAF domain-containing protein, partial [Phycisphaerales bacterium]